jgi:hypothetical protein
MLSVSIPAREQEYDQRTFQHHVSEGAYSDLLYKNSLYDNSKTIFSGLIFVDEGAHHTDAYQTCRNLLMSDTCEANSMPGLEINADQVKCSHGSTSSQIHDEEIFYLRARGIDPVAPASSSPAVSRSRPSSAIGDDLLRPAPPRNCWCPRKPASSTTSSPTSPAAARWLGGGDLWHRFGGMRFLAFYLASGLAASFAQIAVAPESVIPNLGASGAISGVLGAYMVLFPRNQVMVVFFFRIVTIPAVFVLGLWALMQVFSGVGSLETAGTTGGVAYAAHIGGFVAGVATGLIARFTLKSEPPTAFRHIYEQRVRPRR